MGRIEVEHLDDLYKFVYGIFNDGHGTQLFNTLVRGGIDDLDKFETTPLEELLKIRGVGKVTAKRIKLLKSKLIDIRVDEITKIIYQDFLIVTGINEKRIAHYEKSEDTDLLLHGLSHKVGILVKLKIGGEIRYTIDINDVNKLVYEGRDKLCTT